MSSDQEIEPPLINPNTKTPRILQDLLSQKAKLRAQRAQRGREDDE